MALIRAFCFPSLLVIAALHLGCAPPDRLRAAQRYDNGLTLIFTGIEGASLWNQQLAVGLDAGGVNHAIEVVDWTAGFPFLLMNLADEGRQRAEAFKISSRIREYHQAHPSAPVTLLGHSGGCGVVLLTVAELPDQPIVDTVVLLAPAVSPEYDLSPVLRRLKRGLWSFYSSSDDALLGLGTTVFGTTDRTFQAAAGNVGFRTPVGVPQFVYTLYDQRLHQTKYSPALRDYGADGSHLGWTAPEFARRYLSRVVLNQPIEPKSEKSGQ